jgi:hypothetical protein
MKKIAVTVIMAVMLMLITADSVSADSGDNDGNYYCPGYFQSSNSSSGYSCH